MSAIAPSFAELESKIIAKVAKAAKARRGNDGAGDAWLALYDAAQDADGAGNLAARAANRLKQRKNDEYRSRRQIQHPVAMAPRGGITKRRDPDDAVPDLGAVVFFVDDDKRVWTRTMIVTGGLAGTRFKAPDALGDDTDNNDDDAARFDAAVESAKIEVKPRDRVVLACLVDDKLNVVQTARRVGKTKQAVYASIKRMRPVIARHMRQVAIGGAV